MKLIVGLGNPGAQYKGTRHNAGFLAVDFLAKHFGFDKFKKSDKFKAEIAGGSISGEKVLMAKPQTFMNLSGKTTSGLMNFYKIPLEDLIVIYDDAYIDFGSLRIKSDGSAGGHNGVKSIIADIGTQNFTRIRLGIRPKKTFPGALEDYVLGVITDDEFIGLEEVIGKLPKAIESLFDGDIERVMNEYN